MSTAIEETPTAIKIHRTVKVGRSDSEGDVYVEIEFDGKRLSISGIAGPSCGQIQEPTDWVAFEPGWSQELTSKLWSIWRTWHLNDMHAGCQHQRANWDLEKKIEFDSYSIDWDVKRSIQRVFETDQRGSAAIQLNRPPFGGSHAAALLYLLDQAGIKPFGWSVIPSTPKAPRSKVAAKLEREFAFIKEGELAAYNEKAFNNSLRSSVLNRPSKPPIFKKTETKTANRVRPEEHPDGLLCKPCEVCGYKYGSAWLHEDVPGEVIEFLASLPEQAGRTAGMSAFDAQADGFLTRFGISFEAIAGSAKCPPWGCDKKEHNHGRHYQVTLRRPDKIGAPEIEFPFWNSQHDAQKQIEPSAYSVLACISSDLYCPDTLEDFCASYGYDNDSRKAEKLFERCSEFARQLREFFSTSEEREALSEIS